MEEEDNRWARPVLHDVEWKDHELIATGVDAQLQFVRPAGTERARVLHVEGLIR